MKVLVNGGLNISELDGWWAEAYTPEVGWALGDGQEHDSDPAWDAAEAETLYDLLEQEVIPAFYDRDPSGIPGRWIARMRESMARLTPQFSANRTVREYAEKYYLPAANAYRNRAAEKGALGAQVLQWRRTVARHWEPVHFGDLAVQESNHGYEFHVQVYLGELPVEAIRVELYADSPDGEPPVRQEMTRRQALTGSINGYVYHTVVPTNRPASDYTPCITPYHPDAAVPLEASQILWWR